MDYSSIRAARGPPARDNAHDFAVSQRRQSHSTSVLPHSTRAFVLALYYAGRHITVDKYGIKGCIKLLTSGSALWHVCSLQLGGTPFLEDNVCGESLEGCFTILEPFAQRRTLTRLSLSAIPIASSDPSQTQKERIRGVITTLSSTVDTSRPYGYKFSSYAELVSLIRQFPRCDSLDIRDCAAESESSDDDAFYGLPKHKLLVKYFQLGSRRLEYFGLSSLTEDVDLDISLPAPFTCSIRSAEARHVVTVASLADTTPSVRTFRTG